MPDSTIYIDWSSDIVSKVDTTCPGTVAAFAQAVAMWYENHRRITRGSLDFNRSE